MPMRLHSLAVLATTFATAIGAWAECTQPPAPTIADGTSATEEQMVATQQSVKTFIAKGNMYLACLVNDEKSAEVAGTNTDEAKQQRLDNYNAMVEAMQRAGDNFNTALHAFKTAR